MELQFDIANPPDEAVRVIDKMASLRHACMSAPFRAPFKELAASGDGGSLSTKPFSFSFGADGKPTRCCVCPVRDRVVVVFTLSFEDATDRQLARVFLQVCTSIRIFALHLA